MRLYLAPSASTRTAVAHRSGRVLTRAGRPVKSMPEFGAVSDSCRCGAPRPVTARNHPWRDCPQCTPVLAAR